MFARQARRRANPWHANTLEWEAPTPPPHGNFRGPAADRLPRPVRVQLAGGQARTACRRRAGSSADARGRVTERMQRWPGSACTASRCSPRAATFVLLFFGRPRHQHRGRPGRPRLAARLRANMFLSRRRWSGGVLFEHGHRLAASVVGLLTLVLAGCDRGPRAARRRRRSASSRVAAVILQGVLGGITRALQAAARRLGDHACLAQAFFCLTSRWRCDVAGRGADLGRRRHRRRAPVAGAPRRRPVVSSQIVLGALAARTPASRSTAPRSAPSPPFGSRRASPCTSRRVGALRVAARRRRPPRAASCGGTSHAPSLRRRAASSRRCSVVLQILLGGAHDLDCRAPSSRRPRTWSSAPRSSAHRLPAPRAAARTACCARGSAACPRTRIASRRGAVA